MGFASSSAVRVDQAYGSLGGGAYRGMGGGRPLKKKPVLVLDADELAKAHQLFQVGAAEALGEFDPRARVHRPASAIFSGPRAVPPVWLDEEDDYVAPVVLTEADEEIEEELPPIDLDAILAAAREEDESAEDWAEEAWSEEACQPEEDPAPAAFAAEAEPEAAPQPIAERPQAPSPAEALARIIGRAAARPAQAEEVADEPQWLAPEQEPEPQIEQPVWHEPACDIAAEGDPAEFLPYETCDDEAFTHEEAPLQTMPIMGADGTRSTLRARLVRDEMPIAHPGPSLWQKLVHALRGWFAAR
jgi:hypothetical protein